MSVVRRSERIKLKQERLKIIEATNQCFPTVALLQEETDQIKAKFSLPFVVQVRQNSQIEDLANTDTGSFLALDTTGVASPESYDDHDMEYLSDLTELTSDEEERDSNAKKEGVEDLSDLTKLSESSDDEERDLGSKNEGDSAARKGGRKRKREDEEGSRESERKKEGDRTREQVKSKPVADARGRTEAGAVFKPRVGSKVTGKERKALRKQLLAEHRRKKKGAKNREVIQANGFDVNTQPRHTRTRWSGVNAKKDYRAKIMRQIARGRSGDVVRELVRIPYTPHRRICVTDNFSRMFLYRSSLNSYVMSELLPAFNQAAADFVKAVKHPFKMQDRRKNARGLHWFSIASHDRNNKEAPSLSQWHRENAQVVEEYFQPGKPFWHLTRFGCRILSDNFPSIARRYEASAEYMKSTYGIEPMFGLFWNWCLNAPVKGVRRVFCKPHVDHKNLALGVCMVFVYGHFNHKEKCWLVIWEAGIVIELLPGAVSSYLLPSVLQVTKSGAFLDLPVVVTENGEAPTPDNCTPLFCDCNDHDEDKGWQEADGRGSVVWFNQATMFQTAELGVSTVYQVKEMGMDTTCNEDHWMRKDPVFPIV